MAEIKHNNHYISHFYLAGFTPSGSKDDLLFVHDLIQKKSWQTKPVNAGFRKDYYQMQTRGVHPNELENRINEDIETPAALVIQQIAKTKQLPNKGTQELNSLLVFLCLLSIGVPKVRKSIAIEDERRIKDALKLAAESNPDVLDRMIKVLSLDGVELPKNMDAKVAQKPESYSIGFPQKWHITNFLMLFTSMVGQSQLLTERTWSLLVADRDAGHFICSDVPVSCVPVTNDDHHPSRYERPDFGLDSMILMPLTKSLAIEGIYGTSPPVRTLDRSKVSLLNNFLIGSMFSEEYPLRFLYSSNRDFECLSLTDDYYGRKDLMSGKLQREVSEAFLRYQQN